MIIHHQSNVAAFAGNHVRYWPTQPISTPRISITSAAAAVTLAAMMRASFRRVHSRVHGRVN